MNIASQHQILVTGASGFVGTSLISRLVTDGWLVRGALRSNDLLDGHLPAGDRVGVGEIGPETSWDKALAGVDFVVHLAARVHVMHESAADPMVAFRKVNVAGTLNLARQAALSGVRRFVFISSIKVNGEETVPGRPFMEKDQPAPQSAYAISKWEAEEGLLKLSAETGMDVVIIRPPLVYGPAVKANFLSMMCWVARGVPFPVALVKNQRSLVALDNLVDFISLCIEHPAAANEIFLVSDGEDFSTPELLRRLSCVLGERARILPVPLSFLHLGATLVGRHDLFSRLCGSLQIDIGKARKLLGWNPPITVEAALSKTAQYFCEHQWN